ncbi:hypothetical protein PG988_007452 [Apiospora saccharicola]
MNNADKETRKDKAAAVGEEIVPGLGLERVSATPLVVRVTGLVALVGAVGAVLGNVAGDVLMLILHAAVGRGGALAAVQAVDAAKAVRI